MISKIFKIKRTLYSGTKEQYSILDKNNNLINSCDLNIYNEINKLNLSYNKESIEFDIPNHISEKAKIIIKDNQIGYIETEKQNKIINNEYSWIMNYNNKMYNLYEIGFGSKGLYLVIKENDTTIAIISSSMMVKDFKDSYELFIKDEMYSVLTILCCVYWNIHRGTNFVREGISGANSINKVLNTTSKNLINKMDFKFIEQIAASENYIQNNNNKKAITNQLIGIIIFIAFIIFVVVMYIIK